MAQELNCLGCSRTAKQWQHIWNNWVVKTRGRARKVRSTLQGTGGGPPGVDLTEEDRKVLEIAGSASVEGFSNLEVGLPLPSRSPPDMLPPQMETSRSPQHSATASTPHAVRRRRRLRPRPASSLQSVVENLSENSRLLADSIVRAAEIIAAAITTAGMPVFVQTAEQAEHPQ